MSGVTVSGQGFEADAAVIGRAFGLSPAELRAKMRSGAVTSLCEKGVEADEGRFRLTFRHAGRVLRLTVDGDGRILGRATFPAGTNRKAANPAA